jgi:hypothetical protein
MKELQIMGNNPKLDKQFTEKYIKNQTEPSKLHIYIKARSDDTKSQAPPIDEKWHVIKSKEGGNIIGITCSEQFGSKKYIHYFGPFSNIYGPADDIVSNDNLYSISTKVNTLLDNNNNVVLFGVGISGAGKTSALVGWKKNDKHEDGVLQNVLHERNISKIQIYEYAYGTNPPIQYIDKFVNNGAYKTVLETANAVEYIVGQIKKKDRVKVTPNNPESSRTHMVVEIVFDTGGKLTLMDLAGAESEFKDAEEMAKAISKNSDFHGIHKKDETVSLDLNLVKLVKDARNFEIIVNVEGNTFEEIPFGTAINDWTQYEQTFKIYKFTENAIESLTHYAYNHRSLSDIANSHFVHITGIDETMRAQFVISCTRINSEYGRHIDEELRGTLCGIAMAVYLYANYVGYLETDRSTTDDTKVVIISKFAASLFRSHVLNKINTDLYGHIQLYASNRAQLPARVTQIIPKTGQYEDRKVNGKGAWRAKPISHTLFKYLQPSEHSPSPIDRSSWNDAKSRKDIFQPALMEDWTHIVRVFLSIYEKTRIRQGDDEKTMERRKDEYSVHISFLISYALMDIGTVSAYHAQYLEERNKEGRFVRESLKQLYAKIIEVCVPNGQKSPHPHHFVNSVDLSSIYTESPISKAKVSPSNSPLTNHINVDDEVIILSMIDVQEGAAPHTVQWKPDVTVVDRWIKQKCLNTGECQRDIVPDQTSEEILRDNQNSAIGVLELVDSLSKQGVWHPSIYVTGVDVQTPPPTQYGTVERF